MSRRLPVYLLLDTSGSMSGEPIEAVKNGLSTLVMQLRNEPQALETAYLSVITFESSAHQLVPLTELMSFQEPQLKAGGATALGEALILLSEKIDSEVIKGTNDQKGDWKPLVFIFTDGEPTDNWQKGVDEIKKRKPMIVACGAGHNVNQNTLKQITESVVLISTEAQRISEFFKWVSSSISMQSSKISDGGAAGGNAMETLPTPPPTIQVIP
jgi:uncharacterized protein YegL